MKHKSLNYSFIVWRRSLCQHLLLYTDFCIFIVVDAFASTSTYNNPKWPNEALNATEWLKTEFLERDCPQWSIGVLNRNVSWTTRDIICD